MALTYCLRTTRHSRRHLIDDYRAYPQNQTASYTSCYSLPNYTIPFFTQYVISIPNICQRSLCFRSYLIYQTEETLSSTFFKFFEELLNFFRRSIVPLPDTYNITSSRSFCQQQSHFFQTFFVLYSHSTIYQSLASISSDEAK